MGRGPEMVGLGGRLSVGCGVLILAVLCSSAATPQISEASNSVASQLSDFGSNRRKLTATAPVEWTSPEDGSFMVAPVGSNNAWAASGGSAGDGMVLSQYPNGYDGNSGSTWELFTNYQFNNYNYFVSSGGFCLDVPGASTTVGLQIVQQDCGNSYGGYWIPLYVRNSDSAVQWQNAFTGLCIDGGNIENGAQLVQNTCKTSGFGVKLDSQLWLSFPQSFVSKTEPLEDWLSPIDGSIMVLPPDSTVAWMATGVDIASSMVLRDYTLVGNGAIWNVVPQSNGYVFKDKKSGRCLDVPYGSTEWGKQLFVWDCHYGNSEQWMINYIRDYDWAIQWKHVENGLCLDGVDLSSGAPLTQWPCKVPGDTSIGNQLWLPVPPSSFSQTSISGLALPQPAAAISYTKLNALSRHASWMDRLPASVDKRWTMIYPKDQGVCGTCAIFAVVGAVESAYSLLRSPPGTAVTTSLAEQDIVDCFGGCKGGWPEQILEWLAKQTSGLPQTTSYGPYVSGKSGLPQTCNNGVPGVVKVTRFEGVPPLNEKALMAAVSRQPAVAYITLTTELRSWKTWNLFTDSKGDCVPGAQLTHTVLVVGYGTESGVPFWLIRNSFGKTWGYNGHARIKRGICGITTSPLYPVLAPPNGNACGPLNPCGAGSCSNLGSGKYSCTCSMAGYTVAKNTDGTQTCALIDVCGASSPNPCGPGSCVNNGDGNYHCLCFRGYLQTAACTGKPLCVPAAQAQVYGGGGSYTVQTGDTCPLVAYSFGITVQELIDRSYPSIGSSVSACTLTPGVQLFIDPTGVSSCKVFYSVQPGDTCGLIEQTFSLAGGDLSTTLNPGLVCDAAGLPPNKLVCVVLGDPIPFIVCTSVDTVTETDLKTARCASILQRNPQITLLQFYEANRGINCNNLFLGQQVCVAYQNVPPEKCAKAYTWDEGDTCQTVISAFCGVRYRGTWRKCMGPKAGICIGSGAAWAKGRVLCVKKCINPKNFRIPRCVG